MSSARWPSRRRALRAGVRPTSPRCVWRPSSPRTRRVAPARVRRASLPGLGRPSCAPAPRTRCLPRPRCAARPARPTSRACWRCAAGRSSSAPWARSRSAPTCFSSTLRPATTRGAPVSPSTWEPCSICRASVSPTVLCWPPARSRGRSAASQASSCSTARRSAAACACGRGSNPLVVHPGWRVDLETACALVLLLTRRRRTPEPLRRARTLARVLRARDEGRYPGEGVE